MNDHDLLVRMDEKLDELSKQFSNHIRHHWLVTIPVIVMALGLLAVLLIK